ncbi:MAG: hypothetical protein HYY84_09415 [Deltaproteobacteria bacterium]|nr:hypothetical protein [Deltaproteobacteria bacterium]
MKSPLSVALLFSVAAAVLPACKELEKTEPIQLRKREKPKWPAVATPVAPVPVAPPVAAEYEKVPTPIFEDNFDRAAFGDKWRVQGGDWRIEAGAVKTRGARNKCLWGAWELPQDVELEFDARSDFADGDIKFAMFADGENYEGGYTLIFGGWKNSVSLIAKGDEHAIQKKLLDQVRYRTDVKVVQGKVYKYRVVRKGRVLEWFIDGASFLTFDDPQPILGPGFNRFAFCNWESPLTFDNLRVWALRPKPSAPPTPSPASPIDAAKNPPATKSKPAKR